MSATQPLYSLSGAVECRRAAGALGLTLSGRAGEGVLQLAFAGVAPADLPARLEGAEVRRASLTQYLIASGGRSWTISASAVHAHRDVSEAFYAAIPPRAVPWSKRLLWWLVLALAARPLGRRLLVRLRQVLQ